MDLTPTTIAIPLYFVLIGLELVYNHFKKAGLYRLNDAITNINAGATQQIYGVLAKLIPLSIYEFFYHNFSLGFINNSSFSWINFIIIFILWDFCYYWAHRMSHEINLFWSGHVVHHQSEEYNLSVALRQSWFQGIWTAPFYIPLAIIGFDTESVIFASGINLIYQFWIHTETIGKMGVLEYILNTPSHHRVHHGRNPKYIDRNHAGVLIIWDKMFGTFQAEEEKPVYGITTPIHSWNPIWANFSHFETIGKQLQNTSKFSDKLRVLFYKPGWRPTEQGGMMEIPKVNRQTTPKFDVKLPPIINLYILTQYAITLSGTALFLFMNANLSLEFRFLCAFLIAWAVLTTGGILERKRIYYYLENMRVIATPFLLFIWVDDFADPIPTYYAVGAGFWILISRSWLWYFRQLFQ